MKNKENTMKNTIDTNIYALVLQKDNSLKRILLSDFKKIIKNKGKNKND